MNKFSMKVTYGILATLELARHKDYPTLQAKVIAQRQGIPHKFIEQIMQQLKHHGIVRSARGAHGGYTLAKPANQIFLDTLVHSMNGATQEGEVWSNNGRTDGHHEPKQVAMALLSGIRDKVEEAERAVLQEISVQSLVEQYEKFETQRGLMYHI